MWIQRHQKRGAEGRQWGFVEREYERRYKLLYTEKREENFSWYLFSIIDGLVTDVSNTSTFAYFRRSKLLR